MNELLHNTQEAFYRVMKEERKKLLTAKDAAERNLIKENLALMEAQADEYLYESFRNPPDLGINVSEEIETQEHIG